MQLERIKTRRGRCPVSSVPGPKGKRTPRWSALVTSLNVEVSDASWSSTTTTSPQPDLADMGLSGKRKRKENKTAVHHRVTESFKVEVGDLVSWGCGTTHWGTMEASLRHLDPQLESVSLGTACVQSPRGCYST